VICIDDSEKIFFLLSKILCKNKKGPKWCVVTTKDLVFEHSFFTLTF